MPFTIGGDWVPSNKEKKRSYPTKATVKLVKRGNKTITVISNIYPTQRELETAASKIKKKFGCGGAVKEDTIEIQGDRIEDIKKFFNI